MREPMSSEFVLAFVTTCMDAGLSKEATAELLQRQSVVNACQQSPEFEAGYEKVAAMVPGRLRPLARPGYFEKEAAGPIAAGMKALGKHLIGAPKELGKVVLESAKATGRGARNVAGPATGRLAPTSVKAVGGQNWIRRNPMTAVGGATALTGAGMLGINGMRNASRLESGYNVPILAPGGYNSAEANKRLQAQIEADSVPISDLNRRTYGASTRRAALEKAIASNAPDSHIAKLELDKLNSDYAAATKAREEHLKLLGSRGTATENKLKEIKERQAKLESAKTSWLDMPWRAYYRVTGRNPDDVYNSRITQLQSDAAQSSADAQRIKAQIDRLNSGWTGNNATVPTPIQSQARFFPTYND